MLLQLNPTPLDPPVTRPQTSTRSMCRLAGKVPRPLFTTIIDGLADVVRAKDAAAKEALATVLQAGDMALVALAEVADTLALLELWKKR